jgi:hypothetical protein
MYNPDAPRGSRFTVLAASTIYRLYHSVAFLLPDGSVLVAGSEQTTCDPDCNLISPALTQYQVSEVASVAMQLWSRSMHSCLCLF